jgi:hypothetical protein
MISSSSTFQNLQQLIIFRTFKKTMMVIEGGRAYIFGKAGAAQPR